MLVPFDSKRLLPIGCPDEPLHSVAAKLIRQNHRNPQEKATEDDSDRPRDDAGANEVAELAVRIPCGRASFVLRAEQDSLLPPFLGSTIRGGLGHALRKIACLPLCRSVDTCILKERCAYAICFETPVPSGSNRLRRNSRLPHPFLVDPPPVSDGRWAKGSLLTFRLVLVGRAVDHFPYLVAAVDRMGADGLGTRQARFRMESVEESLLGTGERLWPGPSDEILPLPVSPVPREGPDSSGAPPRRVALRFVTPTRLTEDGKVVGAFTFRTLVRSLLSRASSLLYFHCGRELEADFRGLLERAEAVKTIESTLSVKKLTRWSNRQNTAIRLDGVTGRVGFEGDAVAEAWPLLRAGAVLHVGKGTVFGLGKYVIEEAS
jgi:hypothetical protein